MGLGFREAPMWQNAASAPMERDLEVAVIDVDGPHAAIFPCRRVDGGWVNATTRRPVDINPTHWRYWTVIE